MKRFLAVILGFASCAWILASCVQKPVQKVSLDVMQARKNFAQQLTVEPMDEGVKIERNLITFAPKADGAEYVLSGYFNGQILCTSKNTTLKLRNAYLENTAGKPALRADTKTELSVAKDSVNYIVSRGRAYNRTGALQGKRMLILGGGGTLYVSGVCHGIEAEDMKLKGSGTYYVQGTAEGSALNCETLSVEPEKTFRAYFINSKNGIKADGKINVASGNFFLYNNGTALKTDTTADSPKKHHGIAITGGEFHLFGNKKLYITDEDAFSNSGALFVEETL